MEIKKFDIFKKKQKLEVEEFKEARSELLDELLANPIESDEFTKGVENLEKLNKVVLDIEESKKRQPKEFPWEFLAASLSSIPFSLVMTESLVFWEMSIITTWLPADSRATRNAPM